MQSRPWRLAMIAAVLLLSGTAAWAEGEFYVIAGGGGAGTKISSVPYTISAPGFYYLGGNLTYSGNGGNAIAVNEDNVTIDLMGFSLSGPGADSSALGIYMDGRANVEVRNGTMCRFARAIYEINANGNQHRVINIRVSTCGRGVTLSGKNHLIKNCSSTNNIIEGMGLDSGLITDCVVANNGVYGIWINGPGSVLRSTAHNNSFANFSFGNAVATSILVDRNSAYGGGTNYRNNAPAGSVVITANNAGTP